MRDAQSDRIMRLGLTVICFFSLCKNLCRILFRKLACVERCKQPNRFLHHYRSLRCVDTHRNYRIECPKSDVNSIKSCCVEIALDVWIFLLISIIQQLHGTHFAEVFTVQCSRYSGILKTMEKKKIVVESFPQISHWHMLMNLNDGDFGHLKDVRAERRNYAT